jgi:hypothetical protein
MPETAEPTTPEAQSFPWQLLYNEQIALAADLARIDREITALRYRADYELKPRRDVLTVRLADVTEAINQYQRWQRAHIIPPGEKP